VIIWDIDRVHRLGSSFLRLVNLETFCKRQLSALAGRVSVEEFYKAIKPSFVPPYIHWIEVAAIVNAARFWVKLRLLAEIPLSF